MKWRIRTDKYGDKNSDFVLECMAPVITSSGAAFYERGPLPPVGEIAFVADVLLAHFKDWIFIVREPEERDV